MGRLKSPKTARSGPSDPPPWPRLSPPAPGQPLARFTFADGSVVDIDLRSLLARRAVQRDFARSERAREAGRQSGAVRGALTSGEVLRLALALRAQKTPRHKWPPIIAAAVGIAIPQVRKHLTDLGFPSNRKKR